MRALMTVLAVTLGAAQAAQLTVLDTSKELEAAPLKGVRLASGSALRATLEPNTTTGSLETPVIPSAAFDTAIVSWNAITPTGTSLRLEVRARLGTRWTRYYAVGVWSTDPALPRHSFKQSRDKDGFINTDTLELKRQANAVQLRAILSSRTPGVTPELRLLAAVTSDSGQHYTPRPTPSNRRAWGRELNVPSRSQMMYPDGGEVWCSPTSVTMILEHWSNKLGSNLAETVPAAARAVWDSVYDGAGNWPFNTAYAGSKGLRAYVHRLSSLAEAEAFIVRGVPLVMSIGWDVGELDGAHLPRSNGHIVVLRGFTRGGNPIINDPAARTEAGVRTIYNRAQFERAWIGHSGGVIYVIER